MKKLIAIFCALILVFSLAACSGSGDTTVGTTGDAQDSGNVLTDNAPADDSTTLSSMPVSEDAAAEAAAAAQLADYSVDIDLEGLNKNMTTAQMQAIAQDPKSYLGKTIRVTGTYESFYSEQTGKTYNNVIGFDDTGCCAAWNIEFYGDEVPQAIPEYETVSMVGKIDTYDEDGMDYIYIDVSHFAM